MGKQAADISQIRKYLNGELDARAMHQLERRAQDDPFLMDALEGYQNAKADQQANLDDLASRLNKRVAEKRGRIIPFRVISIAASVLVICSAGIWWLHQQNEPVKGPGKSNSAQEATQPLTTPKVDTIANTNTLPASGQKPKMAVNKPAKTGGQVFRVPMTKADEAVTEAPPALSEIQPAPVEADNKVAYLARVNKDTTPLNEVIVMNYKSAKKTDTTQRMALRELRIKAAPDTAPEQKLAASAPGVKVYANHQSAADLTRLLTSGNLGNLAVSQLANNATVQGKVIAEGNGMPIQGASVKVAGTNVSTKTNAAGFFKLNVDTAHANLEVTNRGYKTRQVNAAASRPDSAKTIALAPDDGDALAETVVTGYTSQAKDAGETHSTAHPQKGWSAYRKYLKINAVSPDKAVGVVKVSFIIDKLGSVSAIKVVKGLTDAANKKALSLVKDGPDWTGNSNKQPETVTLRIRFGK